MAPPTSGERSLFQVGTTGQDLVPSAEVYVVGRHVAKAFMIAPAVVPGDESGDIRPRVTLVRWLP